MLVKKFVHHCFDYRLESCHVLQTKFMRICFFRYFPMIREFSAEFGCHYSTVRWNHLLKLQYPKRKHSFHQGKLKSSFVSTNFLQFHDAKPGFPKTIFFDCSKIKIPQCTHEFLQNMHDWQTNQNMWATPSCAMWKRFTSCKLFHSLCMRFISTTTKNAMQPVAEKM